MDDAWLAIRTPDGNADSLLSHGRFVARRLTDGGFEGIARRVRLKRQDAVLQAQRVTRRKHRFGRFIRVNDIECLTDEEHAERHRVERRREGLRLDGLHVEEVADRHGAAEVRPEETQPVDFHLADVTARIVAIESYIAEQKRLSGYGEQNRVEHSARLQYVAEVAIGMTVGIAGRLRADDGLV